MGKKISQLQELLAAGTIVGTDLVVVFDSSAGIAKRMLISELSKLMTLDVESLATFVAGNVDTVDDYILVYDNSADLLRKITPREFLKLYSINGLDTILGNQVAGATDTIGLYDANVNTYKQITVNELLGLVSGGLENWTESIDSNFSGNIYCQLTPNFTDSNIPAVIAPKGTGAFQLRGTGSNRGTRAVDLQIWDSGSSDVAAGAYSCITHGQQNQIGTSGSTSRVGGANANINQYGMDVWANGSIFNSSDGSNQVMRTIMRRLSTAGATAFGVFTNGTSSGPTLPQDGTFWNVEVKIIVACRVQGDGTVLADEAFAHNYKLLIKRSGTTTSLVGAVQEIGTAIADTNMSTVSVAITANDTNESLAIEVTVPNGGTTGQFAATAFVEITQLLA